MSAELHRVHYLRGRKVCDAGHQGRIGPRTRLCAGCLEDSLKLGKVDLSSLPSALDSPSRAPQEEQVDRGFVVLCTGSREFKNRWLVRDALAFRGIDLIIHGGARGADTLVDEEARALGIAVQVMPADWDRYKPKDPKKRNPAGMIRNGQMIKERPALVIAFGEGAGTNHTVKLAEDAGIPVERVGTRNPPSPSSLVHFGTPEWESWWQAEIVPHTWTFVCIGPGPGPKNVMAHDESGRRVTFSYRNWKRLQDLSSIASS